MSSAPSSAPAPASWLETRLPRGVVAALVFAVSFVALYLATGDPSLHFDTSRDLLMARECTVDNSCFTNGPTASFAGLYNGALWIHALAAMRTIGLTITGMHIALLAAHSLAATMVFLAAKSVSGTRAPLAAWALYVAFSFLGIEAPVLWNPTILPLPLVLLQLATALGARTGEAKFAAAAGLAVAFADTHLSALVLVPALFVSTLATSRRALAAVAFVATWLIATFVLSAEMLVSDLWRLSGHPVPCIAAGVFCVVIGLALRAPWRRVEPKWRSLLALMALTTWFSLVLVGGMVVTHHPLAFRYFHTVTPALAWLIGWLAVDAGASRQSPGRATLRRRVALAVVVPGTIFALVHRDTSKPWSLRDAEILASHLYGRGLDYPSIARRLRGPAAFELLAALGGFEPRHPIQAPATSAPELLALHVPDASWLPANPPRGWTILPLRHGSAAILREQRSFLDGQHIDTCVHGGPREACTVGDLSAWVDPEFEALPLLRADPALSAAARELRRSEATRVPAFEWSVTFPLRVDASGPAHHLVVVDSPYPWELALARGSEPAPRAASLRVTPADVPASVVFTRRLVPRIAPEVRGWIPDIVEWDDSERELAAIVARIESANR